MPLFVAAFSLFDLLSSGGRSFDARSCPVHRQRRLLRSANMCWRSSARAAVTAQSLTRSSGRRVSAAGSSGSSGGSGIAGRRFRRSSTCWRGLCGGSRWRRRVTGAGLVAGEAGAALRGDLEAAPGGGPAGEWPRAARACSAGVSAGKPAGARAAERAHPRGRLAERVSRVAPVAAHAGGAASVANAVASVGAGRDLLAAARLGAEARFSVLAGAEPVVDR